MLFLSPQESDNWQRLGQQVVAGTLRIEQCLDQVRSNMKAMFYFYCGVLLAADKQADTCLAVFSEGALLEGDGLFSNAYMASFLKRHNGEMKMPALCFEDPQPFVHFTTTPELRTSRVNFIKACSHTLPDFDTPFSIMDIGTGNGALLRDLLERLLNKGKIKEIDEVLLVDSSPAMLALAKETLATLVPEAKITAINSRIQDVADKLERQYDVALSSLAYHHMPYEHKQIHLKQLKPHINHFIIFEIDANNDTPDLYSPEMALAVYQSYGRIIDFIFQHDTSIDVAQAAVDNFLLTEAISFLTQPRGERTDYHMLKKQWQTLFADVLVPEFCPMGDTDCYADEYVSLYALHYGRG